MVAHAYNSSVQEPETGGSRVQGQFEKKFFKLSSLGPDLYSCYLSLPSSWGFQTCTAVTTQLEQVEMLKGISARGGHRVLPQKGLVRCQWLCQKGPLSSDANLPFSSVKAEKRATLEDPTPFLSSPILQEPAWLTSLPRGVSTETL